jgi:hypothetical protein
MVTLDGLLIYASFEQVLKARPWMMVILLIDGKTTCAKKPTSEGGTKADR